MSSSVDRVEVFSQIQRRRRWSVDQKLAVLAEAAQPGMSISYVARRHGISPSLVFGAEWYEARARALASQARHARTGRRMCFCAAAQLGR